MLFDKSLPLDYKAVQRGLGLKNQEPDENTLLQIEKADKSLQMACAPRWVYKQFDLAEDLLELKQTNVVLQGNDITKHLQHCTSCILLAVTLGNKVEQITRMAEATDMQQAIFLDVASSTLIEQYADLAEEILRKKITEQALFLTGRYSPGYGDLPLELQPQLLSLLNAQRSIGLTANTNCLLLPRKSITAILGVAKVPVTGHLAKCENCALRGKCSGNC